MTRYIDADEIRWCDHFDSDGNKTKYKVAYSDEMPPTIDAIPIEWILSNERMPKEGKGRKVIMDMLEDWRKEHDTAD